MSSFRGLSAQAGYAGPVLLGHPMNREAREAREAREPWEPSPGGKRSRILPFWHV